MVFQQLDATENIVVPTMSSGGNFSLFIGRRHSTGNVKLYALAICYKVALLLQITIFSCNRHDIIHMFAYLHDAPYNMTTTTYYVIFCHIVLLIPFPLVPFPPQSI